MVKYNSQQSQISDTRRHWLWWNLCSGSSVESHKNYACICIS